MTLKIKIQNEGSRIHRDVRVGLSISRGRWAIRPAEHRFTRVTPERSYQRTMGFTFVVGEDPCELQTRIMLRIASSVGVERRGLPLRIRCPGLHVAAGKARVESADGDSTPEAGEEVRIAIPVRNLGRDTLVGLEGRLKLPAEAEVQRDTARWPPIAPFERIGNLRSFEFAISPHAPVWGCGPSVVGPATLMLSWKGHRAEIPVTISTRTGCKL